MKKFLLSIALLAAGATMMNAASFEVSVDGAVVTDGSTVTHNTVEVNIPEMYRFEMDPHFTITNLGSTASNISVTAKAVSISNPEGAEAPSVLQFCIGQCTMINADGQESTMSFSLDGGAVSGTEVHLAYVPSNSMDPDTYESIYHYGKSEFQFTITSGSDTMTFNIIFDYNENSGIDGIEVDNNVAPEYFNLQGVRVANPDNGIYIVRRGNKVSKEIVK